MKRDEKNQQTRRRIMDGALAEFARQGYRAGSLNAICAAQHISKGIIYHYFKTRDALYLACVEECFAQITGFLRENVPTDGTVEERLEGYFSARAAFFRAHPIYQSLFCEAVISPPAALAAEVARRKRPFDDFNIGVLRELLQQLPLRRGVTMEEVVELFGRYQDFINATSKPNDFSGRDLRCQKALDVLLYGVVRREEYHA